MKNKNAFNVFSFLKKSKILKTRHAINDKNFTGNL